ncbi:hypothetical protein PIB30_069335 [Stylosanthes scabra]|uniref:Ubiquitin-like protease family profile domain-containing protein n=1 Tax=Stylosanthes scabra TaxID=79078 RepID=A0ABU6SNB2_9FABA|nr:hypothetical protein [Stylosanthes scabra]
MDEHVSGHGSPLETPKPTQVIKDDLEERVAIWAMVPKGDNDFETIFKLRGTEFWWPFVFIILMIVTLMCHVLNAEEDERFEKLMYCVPPEIFGMNLQRMFATHNHNWMDKNERRPHEISSLKNHTEYLAYLEREKLNSHRFSNILNQLLKWAGAPSILKKGSQSLLPTYINILQQPNDHNCAVFVMKWMELIDHTILAGCCTYNIEQWTEPMLEEFKKKIVVKIIMSKENSLIAEAIKEAHNMRLTRPGATLRSPYVQVATLDLPTK